VIAIAGLAGLVSAAVLSMIWAESRGKSGRVRAQAPV
jgi:hypothetical protein